MSLTRGGAHHAQDDARVSETRAPVPNQWYDAAAKRRLTRVLMAGDALAIYCAFALVLIFVVSELRPRTGLVGLGEASILTVAGMWAMRWQGLWTSNVRSVRVIEVSRITRVLAILSIVALVGDRKSSTMIRVSDVVIASIVAWIILVAWRSVFRALLAAEHKRGRYVSRVIVVGTDRRAADLHQLFTVHPELGMRITAVIGRRHEAVTRGLGHLWAGDTIDAAAVMNRTEGEQVILCSADLDPALIHTLTNQEHSRHRGVFVDPGLSRIDLRRMEATAIGYQPLFELDSASLSAMERFTKRAFDYVVGGIVAVLVAPVVALIALAIKLEDGGPVFFRQERVGRNGERFKMVKFRSMHIDAEARLAELMARNERSGILFKMSDDEDPRITRVGRILRKLSLDELPQIVNVFAGSMSVVGPRPALPREVEQFPPELLARHTVRPGITGLWQAEARDNEHFEAYQRLDLFYVENWSLLLDAVILLATAEHFVLRPLLKKVLKVAGGDPKAPEDDSDIDGRVTHEAVLVSPS